MTSIQINNCSFCYLIGSINKPLTAQLTNPSLLISEEIIMIRNRKYFGTKYSIKLKISSKLFGYIKQTMDPIIVIRMTIIVAFVI
jgi:hypothetical protein